MSTRSAYPLAWRLFDIVAKARAVVWPTSFTSATPYLFILPAITVVGILATGFAYVIANSFRPFDQSTFTLMDGFTAANYIHIFEKENILVVFTRTFTVSAVVTFIVLLFSYPYAFVMVKTRSGAIRKLLLVSVFMPYFIGEIVRAYGWLVILGRNGLINNALGLVGLGPYKLLFTDFAVFIGVFQFTLPFGILMLAPAIAAIPDEVELVSDSLGARWWQTMWHISLPLAKPGFIGGGIVVFTLAVTNFAAPKILGGRLYDFVSNLIFDEIFHLNNLATGSALSVVLVVLGSILVIGILLVSGASTLGMPRKRGT